MPNARLAAHAAQQPLLLPRLFTSEGSEVHSPACPPSCLPLRRYTEVVGKGRFKQIYKAFDTQIGIDVAWSKISAEPHHLSDEQLQQIVTEMTKGLDLEHPNIIKCFECWEDEQHHCINLITELFTSGNLRQYRNLHKHLDLKVRGGGV